MVESVQNKLTYHMIKTILEKSGRNSKKVVFDESGRKQMLILSDSVTGMFFHFFTQKLFSGEVGT